MDKPQYKLNCTLFGHTADVRALAFFEDGTLVSASRDKTARVWRPSRGGHEYSEGEILKGHKNFVGSVCVLNPSTNYPSSVIITGSNDQHIRIYILGELEPQKVIKAHEDTVCNLRTGVEEGTYFSSSWDLSAKLWSLDNPEDPKLILHGHSLSVWCVADLKCGLIVTGSADKLVIVWSRDGSTLHKLQGHTDCVRDIAAIKEDEFLTCANDTTIRHWNAISGESLGIYYGHENFIYGISAFVNGSRVATCGEDQTVRVWENGENSQTVKIPACSVWCVKLLQNADIAAGSSDGVVRIFSCDPNRYASPDVLEIYEKEVEEEQSKAKQQLNDDIQIDKLPDVAVLVVPGHRDGQSLMVREDGKAVAYTWSQQNRTWVKIGDVVGAPEGNSSKQLYNGIEYDYVFSVDIQDGVPPLKLPYNKTEDPWHAAQRFIHQNGLSQMFLDQIANFIIKNSDSVPAMPVSSDYADPFTGGNRYIPGSGMPNVSHSAPAINPDPFTGGNSYVPGSGRPNVGHAVPSATNPDPFTGSPVSLEAANRNVSYIPHKCYLKLEQANANAILDKLKEFNSKINDKLSEATLTSVVNLTKADANDEATINALWKMLLDWPPEFAFPALDVARLAVLNKYSNQHLCSDRLLGIVQRHLAADAVAANQMLTFRLLANMFSQETGEEFGLIHSDQFLNILVNLPSFGSKHNQVAISTYILNLSVSRCKKNDEANKRKTLSIIMSVLPKFKEIEAIFRALVALGTLVAETAQDSNRQQLVGMLKQSETTVKHLQTMANTKSMNDPHGKVAKCSSEILALII